MTKTNKPDDLFLHFALDQYYCDLLELLKARYEDKGVRYSFRQLIELEIMKLEESVGIQTLLKVDECALILDPPKNCSRMAVRIKNKKLIAILDDTVAKTNRSLAKILYTLMRHCLDGYADVLRPASDASGKKSA